MERIAADRELNGMEWKDACWIGMSRKQIREQNILAGEENGHFVYYRCVVEIGEPASLKLLITANSRYRLWVNEHPVLSGPCKGDQYRHYYEQVDVSDYLTNGKNALAVQVLFCDPNQVDDQADERTPILSVASLPVGHRLCVEGQIISEKGELLGEVTTGKADWKLYYEPAYYLRAKENSINFGGICEDIDFRAAVANWKAVDLDDSGWWEPAKKHTAVDSEFEQMVGFLPKLRLQARPIPLLFEQEGWLTEELDTCYFSNGGACISNEDTCLDEDWITIPCGVTRKILFHAGQHMCAYMRYGMKGGKGAQIRFTYFEQYMNGDNEVPYTRRQEGNFTGLSDEVILSGDSIVFEPFWMRTFRFVEIEIKTAEQELIFRRPHYRRTGYPLNPSTRLTSSEKWVEGLFHICVNTLQNCMMETYMDCPFWEQMQFVMDTRLQVLFQMTVSNDTRLAGKALEDFHCSMQENGLLQGKYPCAFPQIISTFSLYYVYMIWDYYQQTGDLEIVRRYRADIDRILEYYDTKIGESGLVEHPGYWPFVDWQKSWGMTGVPNNGLEQPSTVINFMYAYALLLGSDLNEASGRIGMAEEYRERREKLLKCIHECCWNEKQGMYQDGPGVETYCQHAQSWAVLNFGQSWLKEEMVQDQSLMDSCLNKSQAQKMMRHALTDADVIPCSFSTSFELFRALEMTDLYQETGRLMERWIALLDRKCTTCPEEPVGGRSACHAWSALPMYELVRIVAGIKSKGVGWKKVVISPLMLYLSDLAGEVITPQGTVKFVYQIQGNTVEAKVIIPENMNAEFVASGELPRQLSTGENVISYSM